LSTFKLRPPKLSRSKCLVPPEESGSRKDCAILYKALVLCAGIAFRDRLRLFRWTSGSLALPWEIFEEENA